MLNFTEIHPYETSGLTYWVSGIYKIASYHPGEFFAYYIPDGYPNWGENVATPPLSKRISSSPWPLYYYPDFDQAKAACVAHSKKHTPAERTLECAKAHAAEMQSQQAQWQWEANRG